MSQTILVVDDDPHIRQLLVFALGKAGFDTREAGDGEAALEMAGEGPDLIVLDINLPRLNGLDVCRRVRAVGDTPILFLSSRDDEIDRVLGLELGGDDYVTKPFSPRELVARVNVILKRATARPASPEPTTPPLVRQGLALDPLRHVATFEAAPIALTAIEFEIIKALLSRPEMVFNRDRIMALAYSANTHVSDRTIDSHIRNIRAKLALAGCDSAIDTVHGVGFRIGRCEAAR